MYIDVTMNTDIDCNGLNAQDIVKVYNASSKLAPDICIVDNICNWLVTTADSCNKRYLSQSYYLKRIGRKRIVKIPIKEETLCLF